MSPSDAVVPAVQSFKAVEDLVGLVAELANAVIAAPKPLTVASLSMLLPLIPQVEVLAGEIGDLGSQFSALTEAEGEALVLKVGSLLSLKDEHASAVVEASLKLAVAGLELISAIKG